MESGRIILHAASGEFGIYTARFQNATAIQPLATLYEEFRVFVDKDESAFPSGSESSSQALHAPGRVHLLEFLVQSGCDPQQSDDFELTPLHLACLQDNPDVLRTLLSLTTNPSAAAKFGWTPLHLAVLSRDTAKAKAIFEAGGKLGASFETFFRRPNTEISLETFSHCLNTDVFFNLHPLGLAIVLRHLPMIYFLLQRGASIKMLYRFWNPLVLAATKNRISEIVLLAKQGIGWKRKLTDLDVHVPEAVANGEYLSLHLRIDINTPYRNGMTPLLQYILEAWPVLTVVQVMLDLNADVKACDKDGRSVLHSSKLNREIAAVLIKGGASLEARDSSSYSPVKSNTTRLYKLFTPFDRHWGQHLRQE